MKYPREDFQKFMCRNVRQIMKLSTSQQLIWSDWWAKVKTARCRRRLSDLQKKTMKFYFNQATAAVTFEINLHHLGIDHRSLCAFVSLLVRSVETIAIYDWAKKKKKKAQTLLCKSKHLFSSPRKRPRRSSSHFHHKKLGECSTIICGSSFLLSFDPRLNSTQTIVRDTWQRHAQNRNFLFFHFRKSPPDFIIFIVRIFLVDSSSSSSRWKKEKSRHRVSSSSFVWMNKKMK